jgi:sporulation protein YlmC with PRC-barrel domain
MRHAIKELRTLRARASDGVLGKVHDLWFDAHTWTVRHFVLDVARWLPSKRVLVPPELVDPPDVVDACVPVRLSKDEIVHLPRVKARELAGAPLEVYVLPAPIGTGVFPIPFQRPVEIDREEHLVGAREILGYTLSADNESIGHIEDVLIDRDSWRISALIVDIGHRFSHRFVIVEPTWVDKIDWLSATVRIAGPVQRIYSAPELETVRAA